MLFIAHSSLASLTLLLLYDITDTLDTLLCVHAEQTLKYIVLLDICATILIHIPPVVIPLTRISV